MTRMFGMDDEFGEDAILGKLEGMKEVIEQVNKQFKDPVSLSLFSLLTLVRYASCCFGFVIHWSKLKRENKVFSLFGFRIPKE